MKRLFLACLGTLALSVNGLAAPTADQVDLSDQTEQISYSIGYQVGGDLKKQQIEVRRDKLVKGILDALSGTTPLMTMEQMQASLVELKRLTDAKQANPETQ